MEKKTKWFKREKIAFEDLKEHDCPNCGHRFAGHYCPSCGQSDTEFDRPFGFVIYDFLGNFFSFDSRFFKTFGLLLSRPGFLTKEFLAGRRERYAPPFRTFIFLSFVLFLLMQVMTNRLLEKPVGEDHTRVSEELSDSLANELVQINKGENGEDPKLSVHLDSLRKGTTIGGALMEISKQAEKQLETEKDPDSRELLENLVNTTKSPHHFAASVLKYLSWAFFVMLPVFALILALIYIRRKLNFIRHLVFSVHIHSFVFLVHIVLVAAGLLFHALPAWIYFLGFLSIQVYLFLALRNFYEQASLKSFFKLLLLDLIYFSILIFITAIVVVNAFKILE